MTPSDADRSKDVRLTREQIEFQRQQITNGMNAQEWNAETTAFNIAQLNIICDMALRSEPSPDAMWNLVDRAYKIMEMAGYRIAEHDPAHNNPVIAWMADARVALKGKGATP